MTRVPKKKGRKKRSSKVKAKVKAKVRTKATASHYDRKGRPRMVDVGAKRVTERVASAHGFIGLNPAAMRKIRGLEGPKGDPLTVARVAGITAAKRTADMIPMCHPLQLTHVDVVSEICQNGIRVVSTVRCHGRTGVEMEALTAVTVAALTVYDMCKSMDRGAEIRDIHVLEKTGGKSGTYRRPTGKRGR